jgi:DNA-directed RNA polymerase subunit K/omega
MELDITERLEKICRNRYEAVLLVAKQARRINMQRMKAQSEAAQRGEKEEEGEQKEEKVANEALRDVLEGKIDFERPEAKPSSDLSRV